ncbi:MAG: ferredoxin [Chloroflexota bacterium]|jgi:ferredoxin|nr:ferredoxin [Chloroflexota bacterium]
MRAHLGRDLSLAVDRIACDGSGLCAELLPELIELDDWGYPMLTGGPVPDDLMTLARRAVDRCPVLALRLVARQPAARASRPVALPEFVRR